MELVHTGNCSASLRLKGCGWHPSYFHELLTLGACIGTSAVVDADEVNTICMEYHEIFVGAVGQWTRPTCCVSNLESKALFRKRDPMEVFIPPDLRTESISRENRIKNGAYLKDMKRLIHMPLQNTPPAIHTTPVAVRTSICGQRLSTLYAPVGLSTSTLERKVGVEVLLSIFDPGIKRHILQSLSIAV